MWNSHPPPDKSHRGVVREPANARQQETDSLRVHRRLQARNAERCNTGVASRDLAHARLSTKLHASELQHRPVSGGYHHRLASVALHQLGICPFSVPTSGMGDSPIHHSCVGTSPPTRCDGARQCNVDCQLRSVFDRQTGSEDFHLPVFTCRDRHIHLSKF